MEQGGAAERVLAAAESVVIEHGMAGLTFERVARVSGVSRGGVLYHFASKDALITALVARFVERFGAALDSVMAEDPEPAGRISRAYVNASFQPGLFGDSRVERLGSCLMAALQGDPERLGPLREQNRAWQARVEADGLDPVLATIVRLAVEGLWLGEAFDFNRLDDAMRVRVIDRLLALCGPDALHNDNSQAGVPP